MSGVFTVIADALPAFPYFPHLTRLSLNDLNLPPAYLTELLTASALPSLDALALGDLFNSSDRRGFFPSLPTDLLARLTMLQIGRPYNNDYLSAGFSSLGWMQAVRAMREITHTSDAIRSFWLPHALHPSEVRDPLLREAWGRHEAHLEEKGVEIHWMGVDECPSSGGILLEDFLPFAKELRRK
ncbi:hypothetical protein JCM6882_004433 [Rhodosporidiobolus microsporus]